MKLLYFRDADDDLVAINPEHVLTVSQSKAEGKNGLVTIDFGGKGFARVKGNLDFVVKGLQWHDNV